MTASRKIRRHAAYKPALAWFAAVGSAWVFVLVMLGAFTTTIGAGMAFPDWPLSNGSLNPNGWLTNLAMFSEHSHRLSGATMGLITLGIAIALWRTEARSWLRKLGWVAVGIVLLQGIIGGQRVRLDAVHFPGVEMSVGQLLRIPHGILAQLFVIVLFAIAAALSRIWIEAPGNTFVSTPRLRRIGVICTSLILIQLVIAATMRHFSAGLAIPTFPLTPDGTLIPTEWTFRIGLNFAHRAMALLLGLGLIWYAVQVWREGASTLFKKTAATMILLLFLQISLGIAVIWTLRNPYFTTAHVIVGACTLAVTFLLTWFAHHDAIESGSAEKSRVEAAGRSSDAESHLGHSSSVQS
jgi:heme a synthase